MSANPDAALSVLAPVKMTGSTDKKVVFCIPIVGRPFDACIASLEASLPVIEAAGWSHGLVQILNCPYISAARANMLRAALDVKPTCVVFLDYDMEWRPEDMLKLLETEGDVVAGTYRPKIEPEEYMGTIETDAQHRPQVRASDGAIRGKLIPAGFLKITPHAVDQFMVAYPELCYGPQYHSSVDLFNHGVHERIWWGEDYSFARRYRDKCGEIWIIPDINLDHHTKDKVYRGNFHQFLLRQPGGSAAQ